MCGARLEAPEGQATSAIPQKNASPSAHPAPKATPPSSALPAQDGGTGRTVRTLTAREERVNACLREVLEEKDVPAFSHHIGGVMGVIQNDEMSLRKLTNIILRDYSLTLAVLRRANSYFYNRSPKRVCSVVHGLALMGVEAVRSLAGSLLLFEHYRKRGEGLKELLLLSLLTANHARLVAAHIRLPRAEEAYLCGMFRNLGEVLVACHFRQQYAAILEKEKKNPTGSDGCLQVMGFRYEDLGRALASHWHMPEGVIGILDTEPPLPGQKKDDSDVMEALINFSHKLTEVVYRRDPSERQAALRLLLDKHGSRLRLNQEQVSGILSAAVNETAETFKAANIPLDSLQLHRQAEASLHGETLKEGHSPAKSAKKIPTLEIPKAEPEEPKTEENLLDHLAAEVDAAMKAAGSVDLNAILMMVLEACHRGAGFDRAVFLLADGPRTMLRGRMGLGDNVDTIIDRLEIPFDRGSEPLSKLLKEGRDTIVTTPRDIRYQSSPFLRHLEPASFALLPVNVDGLVVACFYLDRLQTPGFPPQGVIETISRLRNEVARAIRQVHQGKSDGVPAPVHSSY